MATLLSSPGLRLRHGVLAWGKRTYVMAILNVTPDSFSGDGLGRNVAQALVRARQAVEAGADILDIGGESTRPGAEPVSADEEIARVVPVIQAIRERHDVAVSVDTYKAPVAEAALDAGADVVNDVWAFRADPAMAPLIARRGVPVVLMHNRLANESVRLDPGFGPHFVGVDYADLLPDVCRELLASVAHGRAAGVADAQVIRRSRHRLRQDAGAEPGHPEPAGRDTCAGLPGAGGAVAQELHRPAAGRPAPHRARRGHRGGGGHRHRPRRGHRARARRTGDGAGGAGGGRHRPPAHARRFQPVARRGAADYSRSRKRWILPVAVLGISSTNSIQRGRL